MNIRNVRYTLLILLTFSLISCGNEPEVRNYTEIFIESDKLRVSSPSNQFDFANMPDDDIHANLNLSPSNAQMPEDDIHASLTNKMPLQNMPDDDIHAGLKNNSSGMAMPADPVMQDRLNQSVDRSPLSWQTPKGWIESKGSGMRMATFTNSVTTEPFETTIISLGGNAGGVEANIIRWMGQIGIDISTSELDQFIQQLKTVKTADNIDTAIVDLTLLQKGSADNTPSIVASIIDRGSAQIFIKMTGTKSVLQNNLTKFKNLVESISLK